MCLSFWWLTAEEKEDKNTSKWKSLWWLDLKDTGEIKYLEPCPHDRTHKYFYKTIPSFDSSVIISSKLPWLLLLKLAVGLVMCGHHKSSSPCGDTISLHEVTFPKNKKLLRVSQEMLTKACENKSVERIYHTKALGNRNSPAN